MKYDIELEQLRFDIEEQDRDNLKAVQQSLLKIQEILLDIDKRLRELE